MLDLRGSFGRLCVVVAFSVDRLGQNNFDNRTVDARS